MSCSRSFFRNPGRAGAANRQLSLAMQKFAVLLARKRPPDQPQQPRRLQQSKRAKRRDSWFVRFRPQAAGRAR
ncbi:hypothetical protein TKK_0000544 [Trichogramma kaykai]